MEYEEARSALIEQKLDVKKEEQFSEEVEEDDVISQDPASGTMVKEDSTVTLYVSIGAEKTELGDYIGKQKDEV
ncbi:PASTA domain-containing protein, partial [Staphylococcus sp. SIMBA_130]